MAIAWGQAAPVSEPAVVMPPATAPVDGTAIREQTIYIPYQKLREVFEKEGRGVFLPYDRFLTLWRTAAIKTAGPTEADLPVPAMITQADHQAVVSKDVVQVTARLRIEVLKEGWVAVPLHLNDAAILKATLDQQPARLVFTPGRGHELLIQKEGKLPKVYELVLEYAKAFDRAPGRNQVRFDPPQSPVSQWRITVPERGVKVNVQPLLASMETAATAPAEQTVVTAFVGAAATVHLDWTPRAEGAQGLQALATALVEQQVMVDEGVVRTRAKVQFRVNRAQLPSLILQVPAQHKVVNLSDPNVRQWTAKPLADGQIQEITVQLFEPAQASQNLQLDLERFVGDQDKYTLEMPMIRALGVERQQGVLVARIASGLRAEASRTAGLIQLDAAELPPDLVRDKWDFAYRYAATPYDLTLAVEKVQPQLVIEALVQAALEPEELTLQLWSVIDVQRAGVFELQWDIPAGYEVRQVTGQKLGEAKALEVAGHQLTGDNKNRLVVNLARKAIGKVGLSVQMHRRLNHPELLTPTGQSALIPLAMPAAVGPVERQTGRLLLHGPRAIWLTPRKVQGMRVLPVSEVTEAMIQLAGAKVPGDRFVFTFAYDPVGASVELEAHRRPPFVTVRQLLSTRMDVGVIKYEAAFHYDVAFSPVRTLRLDIPQELAGKIRNLTPRVRETVLTPAPADLTPGCMAWQLTGDSEFFGPTVINLAWEEKIEKLGVGQSVQLALPVLRPRQVDRAWGQIVLIKSQSIDLREAGQTLKLRPIDPQRDIQPPMPQAARAFEFHEPDWQLTLAATHYRLQEIKRTSIERAVARVVFTRGQETVVQALYRIQSVQQRLGFTLPEGVKFDTNPARINGRPVTIERDDKNQFFIPLNRQNPDEPFLLDLRYSLPRCNYNLELPVLGDDPAMQKMYLFAYVPDNRRVLGAWGPWTLESGWRLSDWLRWLPRPRQTASDRLAWVAQGISVTGSPSDGFQTDGYAYLYTSMSPPPQGMLRLTTFNSTALAVVVIGGLAILGLALLPASAGRRWLGLGALLVLVLLAGVFFPCFAIQAFDGLAMAAVLIIAILWLVHYLAWVRPHDPQLKALRQARHEARLARLTARPPAPPKPQPVPVIAIAPAPGSNDQPSKGA